MPIYEYRCQGCGHEFELLVLKATSRPVRVPERRARAARVGAGGQVGGTHALAMKAAKKRDSKQASENNRAQREYELHHND